MSGKAGRLARLVGINLLVFLALLAILEVALRVAGYRTLVQQYAAQEGESARIHAMICDKLGRKKLVLFDHLFTDGEGIFRGRPGQQSVKGYPFNADGFRGNPFVPVTSLRPTLLLVGDSFTWGASAKPLENSFADLLGAAGYHVYNAGIPGTGPAQYSRLVGKYVPRLKPMATLVFLYLGNDLKPVFELLQPNRNLHFVSNFGFLRGYDDAGRYFRDGIEAFDFLRKRYCGCIDSPLDAFLYHSALGRLTDRLLAGAGRMPLDQGQQRVLDELQRMREVCRQNGSRFFLFMIPVTQAGRAGPNERGQKPDPLRRPAAALPRPTWLPRTTCPSPTITSTTRDTASSPPTCCGCCGRGTAAAGRAARRSRELNRPAGLPQGAASAIMALFSPEAPEVRHEHPAETTGRGHRHRRQRAVRRPQSTIEEQMARAYQAAQLVKDLVLRDFHVVVVHGNGPQVGMAYLRQLAGMKENIPPMDLALCDAMTQAEIGTMLELAIINTINREKPGLEVLTIVSQVEVAADDPAFQHPTKPVGPFYTAEEAEQVRLRFPDWTMIEDSGRGYRRVVPSPKPLKVFATKTIPDAFRTADVVIAGGGGGIPVVRKTTTPSRWSTRSSTRTAPRAWSPWASGPATSSCSPGCPASPSTSASPGSARCTTSPWPRPAATWRRATFPPGSMGPKIEAAIEFAAATGGTAIITNSENITRAIDGQEGTHVAGNARPGIETVLFSGNDSLLIFFRTELYSARTLFRFI